MYTLRNHYCHVALSEIVGGELRGLELRGGNRVGNQAWHNLIMVSKVLIFSYKYYKSIQSATRQTVCHFSKCIIERERGGKSRERERECQA